MESSRWKAQASLAGAPLAVFGIWLLIALATAANAWREREVQISEVELGAQSATALLQAHTANIFQSVDVALQEIVRTVETEDLPQHDSGFRKTLRARLPGLPHVRALYVIDRDGRIVHDTDYPDTPDVSLADRDYFREHLASAAIGTRVSAPILSRTPGVGWFVAASRRISSGAEFDGVAVAAIELKYFSALYQRVGLGEGSFILLFSTNGRLLAQYPESIGEIGQSFADVPLFTTHLPQAPSGVYRSSNGLMPRERVVSYATVPGQPLVVCVAQDLDVRLRAWRRTALATGAGLLLLLAASMFGAVQYARAVRQRRYLRERMRHAEKMEALGQLTGGIAHDFGNTLSIVAMNLPLLAQRCADDAAAAEMVQRMQRAVDQGTQLVRRLMAFSRRREVEVVQANLNDAISAALPLLQQAAGSQVTVAFEPDPQLAPCRVDLAQLETSLLNLVMNARHAIQDTGRIVVQTRNAGPDDAHLHPQGGRGRYVRVTVADNGCGMPEAVRRRAIEPFFTTKGEQGTGLGLSQIYGYVQQLGGDMAIESEVGRGTAVHLYFPAA